MLVNETSVGSQSIIEYWGDLRPKDAFGDSQLNVMDLSDYFEIHYRLIFMAHKKECEAAEAPS